MTFLIFMCGLDVGLLIGLVIKFARRHRERRQATQLTFRIGPVSDVRPSRPSPKE